MATIGLRTLMLIFGAGYGGSYVYNNIDQARSIVAQLLLQQPKKAPQTDTNAPSANTDILSARMDALARELNRTREPVVVVGPSSALNRSLSTVSDVLNLLGWAIFAVSIGGVMYYVAVKKKNMSLRDLAWVSQSTFNGTISAMQKGITRVSGAVGAVRRDLGERLKLIEGRVDRVRASLSEKIEEEVADVKSGIEDVGGEVSDVKGVLENVNVKVEQLDGKLDTATTGIIALVKVVSALAPHRLEPGSPFYELRRFAEDRSDQPLLKSRVSSGGLRGLLGGELLKGRETREVNSRENSVKEGGGKGNKARDRDLEPLPWET